MKPAFPGYPSMRSVQNDPPMNFMGGSLAVDWDKPIWAELLSKTSVEIAGIPSGTQFAWSWREVIPLDGARFSSFNGQRTGNRFASPAFEPPGKNFSQPGDLVLLYPWYRRDYPASTPTADDWGTEFIIINVSRSGGGSSCTGTKEIFADLCFSFDSSYKVIGGQKRFDTINLCTGAITATRYADIFPCNPNTASCGGHPVPKFFYFDWRGATFGAPPGDGSQHQQTYCYDQQFKRLYLLDSFGNEASCQWYYWRTTSTTAGSGSTPANYNLAYRPLFGPIPVCNPYAEGTPQSTPPPYAQENITISLTATSFTHPGPWVLSITFTIDVRSEDFGGPAGFWQREVINYQYSAFMPSNVYQPITFNLFSGDPTAIGATNKQKRLNPIPPATVIIQPAA